MVRAAIVALVLCASSPSYAGPRGDYKEYLAQRDDEHASTFQSELTQANAAVVEFREAMAVGAPEEDVALLYRAAMEEVHQASQARGRGLVLSGFKDHFLDKPSLLESELWLQSEADKLGRDYNALSGLFSDFERAREAGNTDEVVAATQRWTEVHGEVLGRSQELASVTESFYIYAKRKGQRDAKLRSVLGSFFGGLVAGLASQQRTAPPQRATPWMAHCQIYFSGTQCLIQ